LFPANEGLRGKLTYIPVMGTLTADAIMTVRTRELDGIGVVPMDARVESKQMMT
jgi:hypothetical protein